MALIDNVRHWYEMDEASGDIIDRHGTADLVRINTPTQVAGGGPDGTDVTDFDRSGNDALETAAANTINFADEDISIITWVKLDSVSLTQYLMTRENPGEVDDFQLWINSSNQPQFRLTNPTPISYTINTGANTVSVDTWHMIAVYYDSVNDDLAMSLDNGSFFGNSNVPNGFKIDATDSQVYFGAPSSFGRDGKMCKTVILNSVVTSGEMDELWNSGSGITYNDIAPVTFTPRVRMI